MPVWRYGHAEERRDVRTERIFYHNFGVKETKNQKTDDICQE